MLFPLVECYEGLIASAPESDIAYQVVLGDEDLRALPRLQIPVIFNIAYGFDYPKT